MSDLDLKQLKVSKDASRRYNNVTTVNDFLIGEAWFEEINASAVNKINAWLNVHL